MESFSTEDITQHYYPSFFSDIDINFARLILLIAQDGGAILFLTAALLSRCTGAGNVCFNLEAAAAKPLTDDTDPVKRIICPKLEDWISALRTSPAVGKPGELTPMVFDQSFRLYLHRYWEYEQQLAAALKERASGDEYVIDKPVLREGLSRLFPPIGEGYIDWQKFAA
ncbi:MAG: hypothetical protein QGH27_09005, partial [SAR324 cluster bacterium]|nr:hypothetical protein [SAR324 cluster bacterium]